MSALTIQQIQTGLEALRPADADYVIVAIGVRGTNVDCLGGNAVATVRIGRDEATSEAVHLVDAIGLARAKGHAVVTTNFLEHPADPEFDAVVMNPPFYGRHYVKHVRHAYKFLKPGGTLVAILPATARYDHGELEGEWRDLPVASFAEAGTNVPTTMLKMQRTRS